MKSFRSAHTAASALEHHFVCSNFILPKIYNSTKVFLLECNFSGKVNDCSRNVAIYLYRSIPFHSNCTCVIVLHVYMVSLYVYVMAALQNLRKTFSSTNLQNVLDLSCVRHGTCGRYIVVMRVAALSLVVYTILGPKYSGSQHTNAIFKRQEAMCMLQTE